MTITVGLCVLAVVIYGTICKGQSEYEQAKRYYSDNEWNSFSYGKKKWIRKQRSVRRIG